MAARQIVEASDTQVKKDLLYDVILPELLRESERERLRLVVVGEAGIGKTSIVNGVLRKKIAHVGHSKQKGTGKVEKYEVDRVILWDTPGFGLDDKDTKVLENMADECKPVDLILYCIKMDNRRWPRKLDSDTIKAFTKQFGREVWKNCLFVLTFANQVAGLCPEEHAGSGDFLLR